MRVETADFGQQNYSHVTKILLSKQSFKITTVDAYSLSSKKHGGVRADNNASAP
jgi:hypothetical protein